MFILGGRGLKNCRLCKIVHLTVELCIPEEISVSPFIIFVGLDMRENAGERQLAAVGHDILEDIRVAALGGNPIWGEVFNFVQSPQAVQKDLHGARQIRGYLVNSLKNQMIPMRPRSSHR